MEAAADWRHDRIERTRLIAIFGISYQALYALLQLVCLAVLARHTSKDVFGLWLTALALATWLPMVNMGQPAALLTKLGSVALTDRPLAQRLFSASTAIVVSALALMSFALFVATPLISWATLLNATTRETINASTSMAMLALGLTALATPATLAGFAIQAHQRGDIVHLTMTAGSLIGFLVFVLAISWSLPIQIACAAMIAGPVLGGLALWLMSAGGHFVSLPRWSSIDAVGVRSMLRTGVYFMAIDTASLALVRTPDLIVAHLYGSVAVGLFSSIGRLPLLMLAMFQALLLPYWPALGAAAHRGDHAWVRQVIARSLRNLLAMCLIGIPIMAWLGPPFVRLWLGTDDAAIRPLIAAACVQSLGMAMLAWLSVMFGALSMFRQQVILLALAATLYFPTAIALAHHLGPIGVSLGQAGILLLFVTPIGCLILYRRLNGTLAHSLAH